MQKPSYDSLNGKTVVITGGAGVICQTLAHGLAQLGMKIVLIDIDEKEAARVAWGISDLTGADVIAIKSNVLDKESLEEALDVIHSKGARIDFLVNGAGGNSPGATTKCEQILDWKNCDPRDTFFGLDTDSFRDVFDLNFKGTLLPTMVFSRDMLSEGRGAILNISSMNAFRPLTRIPAYSAAKASVNNFTEWLAVHFAKTGVRVNALAPGFILTKQNRYLLIDQESGELTGRGVNIIRNSPMGRFGLPEELIAPAAFLLSDQACFITGSVLTVDGGFNIFSGV